MMHSYRTLVVICLAGLLGIFGCAGYRAQQFQDTEQRLLAAGFIVQGPDTPERRALLEALPPHQVVRREISGTNYWIYAEPTVQNCLYIGDERANEVYKTLLLYNDAGYDERYTPRERFEADVISGFGR